MHHLPQILFDEQLRSRDEKIAAGSRNTAGRDWLKINQVHFVSAKSERCHCLQTAPPNLSTAIFVHGSAAKEIARSTVQAQFLQLSKRTEQFLIFYLSRAQMRERAPHL
jgi:hypothetical protein